MDNQHCTVFCYTTPVTFHHGDVTWIDHDMHFDTYTGIIIYVIFFTNISFIWFLNSEYVPVFVLFHFYGTISIVTGSAYFAVWLWQC
jgi:hypothetical protein